MAGAARPRAVVFDVAGVLAEWRPERLYGRLIADPAARARFLSDICPPGWTAPFERGASLTAGVAAHAEAHPPEAELIRAWWSCWPEMFGPANAAALALVGALRARGRPVFCLAEFAAETWPIARRLYPALENFDLTLVSAEIGAAKPDAAAYAALEAASGLGPEALLLVDDAPECVAAARARGWSAHLFRGAAGLSRTLIELDLLAPSDLPRRA